MFISRYHDRAKTKPKTRVHSQSQHATIINDNALVLNIQESVIPTPTNVIDLTSQPPHTKNDAPKRDLTLITGSCLLKGIETRFLDENIRVKSYRNAKIKHVQGSIAKMDLSRYKKLILHVGGHDIDANIDQNTFRQDYQSLLSSLSVSGCKVYVSGLLPRGGTNKKPFNAILKDLCETSNAIFIDNHNSFIMASGQLPVDFFHADRVNLRFLGIRPLVHNIHESCPILPKKQTDQNTRQNGQYRQSRFPQRTHMGKRYHQH